MLLCSADALHGSPRAWAQGSQEDHPQNIDSSIPTPKEVLGQDVGADRFLATYSQLQRYWRDLAKRSPRMSLENIGTTSYGQEMLTAIITSPGNHARLEEYRKINERICRARDEDVDVIGDLLEEGKPVIWIDAGMHANESVAAQNILELVYRLCARRDAETLRILDRVICLVTPANPDGMEMIAKAYMATGRVGGLPVLYQKYIGHDNNRDYYAVNMPETRAICRMLYKRWYPQVIYNHHQSAPRGTVLFTPPFRDPFNYNVDPLVVRGIEIVAAHMNTRFTREEKAGVISRSGAPYSTWWNGGLRTTAYFHNMIGILTEAFGHPTPRPLRPDRTRRLPYTDYPLPIGPQKLWHARQTIEYLQTANYAILDYASRYGRELQGDMWRIGRRAIQKARSDHRTSTPKLVARMRSDKDEAPFRDPATRDARAYIIPRAQEDFAAATRLVQALVDCGAEVERLVKDSKIAGEDYGAGSFVVRCDQAFRAHVRDMFEAQWHPDDIAATGEPIRPYDSAGWTLAMQLGVAYARVYENFAAATQSVPDRVRVLPGKAGPAAKGWVLSCEDSNAYRAIGRLLDQKIPVYTSLMHETGVVETPARYVAFVPKTDTSRQLVPLLAREFGLDFRGFDADPPVEKTHLRRLEAPRIGIFDVFGGNMAAGWARWVFESFGFRIEVVDGARVTAGKLDRDFDVLLFVTGLPNTSSRPGARPRRRNAKDIAKLRKALPAFEDWSKIEDRLVVLTRANALSPLKRFVRGGGTILGIGESGRRLIDIFELPFRSGVRVERERDEGEAVAYRPANRSEFFIPGSLIRVRYEKDSVLGNGAALLPGMRTDNRESVVMFRRSPVFERVDTPGSNENVASKISTPIVYADEEQLASGWAIGQERLKGKAAAIHARIGQGNVFVFGPDMLYRGQPWGSFHAVFRAVMHGASSKARRLD